MQKRLLFVICFVMLMSVACKKTTENKIGKKQRDVKNKLSGGILVETEYGNYVIDEEWFDTQETLSVDEGFSHSYSKPDAILKSNNITISYSIIPEEADISNHKFIISRILDHYQKSELYFGVTVDAEDYKSENHQEAFKITFTNNNSEVVTREYIILKSQAIFNVREEISSDIYTLTKQEQKEMNEVSDRIAKRALESFQWID